MIQPFFVKLTAGGFLKVGTRQQMDGRQTDHRMISFHQTSEEAHKARKWWKKNRDVLLVKYGARQVVPLIPPWADDPEWFERR